MFDTSSILCHKSSKKSCVSASYKSRAQPQWKCGARCESHAFQDPKLQSNSRARESNDLVHLEELVSNYKLALIRRTLNLEPLQVLMRWNFLPAVGATYTQKSSSEFGISVTSEKLEFSESLSDLLRKSSAFWRSSVEVALLCSSSSSDGPKSASQLFFRAGKW